MICSATLSSRYRSGRRIQCDGHGEFHTGLTGRVGSCNSGDRCLSDPVRMYSDILCPIRDLSKLEPLAVGSCSLRIKRTLDRLLISFAKRCAGTFFRDGELIGLCSICRHIIDGLYCFGDYLSSTGLNIRKACRIACIVRIAHISYYPVESLIGIVSPGSLTALFVECTLCKIYMYLCIMDSPVVKYSILKPISPGGISTPDSYFLCTVYYLLNLVSVNCFLIILLGIFNAVKADRLSGIALLNGDLVIIRHGNSLRNSISVLIICSNRSKLEREAI